MNLLSEFVTESDERSTATPFEATTERREAKENDPMAERGAEPLDSIEDHSLAHNGMK